MQKRSFSYDRWDQWTSGDVQIELRRGALWRGALCWGDGADVVDVGDGGDGGCDGNGGVLH